MIGRHDRVVVAPGVCFDGRALIDPVRGTRIAINASAAVALTESTPARMARAISARFDVDVDAAEADARDLCAQLNTLLLLNVRAPVLVRVVRWFVVALALAPMRRLPSWPSRRHALTTASALRATWTAARGCGTAALVVATFAAIPFVAIGLWRAGVAAGAAAAAGLILHEAAHAAALRGLPAALIVRGIRVSVLHGVSDARTRARVSAAGPVAAATTAVVVAAIAAATGAAAAAVAALVLAPHAVSLTMLGTDGRTLCAAC